MKFRRTAGSTTGAISVEQFGMRAGDYVMCDQLADFACRFSAGINRRFHAADVATDDRGDERPADLDRFDDLDVGGFAHGIGGFDQADPALGFNETQSTIESASL